MASVSRLIDAVVAALHEDPISGVTVKAFDHESASTIEDSAFPVKDTLSPNLTFSPYVGYFSRKTLATMNKMVQIRIKNFVAGSYDDFRV